MFDQKDLYIDNEIEEFKVPLQMKIFSEKAQKILEAAFESP